jgi:hypothetical protein
MKRTALRMMIAAAAAMAAVATASAEGLKAEIPFPFEAAGARMQAGTYWVSLNTRSNGPAVQISNVDTRKSVLALSYVNSSPSTLRESEPVLTFTCTSARCVLSSIRDDHSTVYGMRTGKSESGARIATVALKVDRAE